MFIRAWLSALATTSMSNEVLRLGSAAGGGLPAAGAWATSGKGQTAPSARAGIAAAGKRQSPAVVIPVARVSARTACRPTRRGVVMNSSSGSGAAGCRGLVIGSVGQPMAASSERRSPGTKGEGAGPGDSSGLARDRNTRDRKRRRRGCDIDRRRGQMMQDLADLAAVFVVRSLRRPGRGFDNRDPQGGGKR